MVSSTTCNKIRGALHFRVCGGGYLQPLAIHKERRISMSLVGKPSSLYHGLASPKSCRPHEVLLVPEMLWDSFSVGLGS